jgi:transcriptional regulator with GAF, ATPase, and Fis domain
MTAALRLHLLCEEAGAWEGRLREALVAERLSEAAAEDDPEAASLVLYDAFTPTVVDEVTRLARGGRACVFAVAVSEARLRNDELWQLLRCGASDAFCWQRVGRPMAHLAERLRRWTRIAELLELPVVRRELIGRSARWLSCLRQLVEIATFGDGPILLLGESGTGKELLSRLVHTLDQRPGKGELVVLDCTTVVPELSGSEFFGHERGAFTGAVAARDGAFALADRGTLFLDEVGELPLTLQAQLLRVIQEGTYKRVGSNTWQRTNLRLIYATHRDLRQDVASGRFRHDFYHRIASRICHVPPLRDRRDDILPLARHFLESAQPKGGACDFDPVVGALLTGRDYPGNVRELRQLVARMSDRHVGPGPITAGDVPEDERPASSMVVVQPAEAGFDHAVSQALDQGVGLREIGRVATETAIRLALEGSDGNLQRAAKRLGVTDRALQLRRAQRPES